jgi:hypothetical protein
MLLDEKSKIRVCGTSIDFSRSDWLLLSVQNAEKYEKNNWEAYCQMAGISSDDADARQSWEDYDPSVKP